MQSDVIVLGAGVTGLTAAAELTSRGLKVMLLDDYPTAGGNHISVSHENYTFDIGSIFFWSDSPLATLFPGIEKDWIPVDYLINKISPDRSIKKYPFDIGSELLQRGAAYTLFALCDIVLHKIMVRRQKSAADFVRYYIGNMLLTDSGLANYLERFYGLSVDEISYNFAERRMSWIAANGSIRRRLLKLIKGTRPMRNVGRRRECFARPREGFARMYDIALDYLKERGVAVILDAGMRSISRNGSSFFVDSGRGLFGAARVISTIPLARSAALVGLDFSGGPESSLLVTLFCRFRGRRNFKGVVLYNFHRDGLWKRLTMHSDYYGPVESWEYFSVEVTMRGKFHESEFLFDDFRNSTRAADLFDGDLELVDVLQTEFAYPVYDHQAAAKRALIVGELQILGVETIGRQGDFNYIPSAAEAVRLAQIALKA